MFTQYPNIEKICPSSLTIFNDAKTTRQPEFY